MGTARSLIVCLVLGVGTVVWVGPAGAQGAACPAPAPLTFSPPRYIDTTRAGGEPTIATHPDGTYLVGTHAGSSHFYTPEAGDEDTVAFPQNYRGQAYYYWSADHGTTWHYVPRDDPPANVPGSGYSDPDFAIDTAGQVFISEINLVNIAMSKSTDVGRSYALQNILAQSLSDRQWSDADQKDVVYMSGNSFGGGTSTNPVGNEGHYLYRSTDGGRTFTPGLADGTGDGDLKVDQRNGTLYEPWPNRNNGTVAVAIYRKARTGDMAREVVQVATGGDLPSIGFHSVDVDPHGNVYLSWKDNGEGASERPPGVYYSYSVDEGRHWAAPIRVDTDDRYDHWPWLAVGDDGHVAIAWLQADIDLPTAEQPGFHGWRVVMAQTTTGLGCGAGRIPGFTVTTATAEPMHVGTICDNGTICQAQVIDRRLGDYFTLDIDTEGKVWAVYSDTRQGGAVAFASFVRQTGGPSFKADLPAVTPPTTAAAPDPGGDLPATGHQDPGRILLVLAAASVGVSQLRRVVDRRRRLT